MSRRCAGRAISSLWTQVSFRPCTFHMVKLCISLVLIQRNLPLFLVNQDGNIKVWHMQSHTFCLHTSSAIARLWIIHQTVPKANSGTPWAAADNQTWFLQCIIRGTHPQTQCNRSGTCSSDAKLLHLRSRTLNPSSRSPRRVCWEQTAAPSCL